MNKIATKSEIKFVKSLKLKKNRVKENKFFRSPGVQKYPRIMKDAKHAENVKKILKMQK